MIGIMDWGIGGLSVYKGLRASLAPADILYLSDSGATPYGKQSREELRARFADIAAYFHGSGVRNVLVACNAASSALERDLEPINDVLFHSIIPAGVDCVAKSNVKSVGVIGGHGTINSGVYQARLAHIDKSFSFFSAQPLSGFVEAGELGGPEVESAMMRVLEALPGIDGLLLACTHYPALAPLFQKLAPDLELLDPAVAMVRSHREMLSESGKNELNFVTTGDLERSRESALRAFGIDITETSAFGIEF